MRASETVSISHFGVCVSDMDRSLRFYRDALGFTVAGKQLELVNQCGNVMGMEHFSLMSQFLSLGPVTIELLWFRESRNAQRAENLRPMNHTGLTHLALSVEDIDAVARAVESHGGHIHPATRGSLVTPEGVVDLLYCSDPDHTRIELIRYPRVLNTERE